MCHTSWVRVDASELVIERPEGARSYCAAARGRAGQTSAGEHLFLLA